MVMKIKRLLREAATAYEAGVAENRAGRHGGSYARADAMVSQAARQIVAALARGKRGLDFRSGRPYAIGCIGGAQLVAWPGRHDLLCAQIELLGALPHQAYQIAANVYREV